MKTIIFLIVLLFANELSGQSLHVFDIETKDFPLMRAKFYAFDAIGNQLNGVSKTDFVIRENGEERNILNVRCSNQQDVTKVSVALSVDISGSMSNSINGKQSITYAKATATELCNLIIMPPSEIALLMCNSNSLILNDFTSQKSIVLDNIIPIYAHGGNDFDEQLLNPSTGLLSIAKTGKYKRVAVIFTDAYWHAMPSNKVIECIQICQDNGIALYSIFYSDNKVQPDGIKASLKQISESTGGKFYDGITTTEAAQNIANVIQNQAQSGEPCIIEWESQYMCDINESREVELETTLIPFTTSCENTYLIPEGNIIEVSLTPTNLYFRNKPIGVKSDTTIILVAENMDIDVADIISSNPAFEVNPKVFALAKKQSIELTVSYTPTDSSYNYTQFSIIANQCEINYQCSGGYSGHFPTEKTLKLTHPNGGEVFLAGSDTIITWEGVLKDDKVNLQFSADNGLTWVNLTDDGHNFIHRWDIASDIESDQCLMQANQFIGINQNKDPGNIIEWTRSFGGSAYDLANSILQTIDGGYIVSGNSASNDGLITDNHGLNDFWVLKIDNLGNIQWKKSFGGSGSDYSHSIKQTRDGGFVIAGYTESEDGDVSGLHGDFDYWVVKLDNLGELQWQKCLGGSKSEIAHSICETKDGGFVVAGYTNSNDGEVTDYHDESDFWVVRLNSAGVIQWQRCLGGSYIDVANSVTETNDGGFIIAGYTNSYDGDVTGIHGWSDYWIVKLDMSGTIQWQKCFGGSNIDIAYDIQQTYDKGYVVAGYSDSQDGDVTGNLGWSYWIIKLNESGELQWQKSLGGSQHDEAYSIRQTLDSGYIVAGVTASNDGDVSGYHDMQDYWVLKLDATGNIQWQKCLGGSNYDAAYSAIQTLDEGYIVAGVSSSNDNDVAGTQGGGDFWIAKLLPDNFYFQSDTSDAVFSIVKPQVISYDINMGQAVINTTKDSVFFDFISNVKEWPCRIDSIYFSGIDAKYFHLDSPIPEYTVEANGAQYSEFSFSPDEVRHFQATLVIVTQVDTLFQNISGDGILPNILVVNKIIDFGRVYMGETRDSIDAVTITNASDKSIYISKTEHIFPNATDFTTTKGAGPFTLEPGDTCKMDLQFTANKLGRQNGLLLFHHDAQGSPHQVILFGEGYAGNSVSIDDIIFADQPVGTKNDSTVFSYFQNIGPYENKIDSVFLVNGDVDQFELQNVDLPIYINKDENLDLEISFLPKSTGNKYTNLCMICQSDTIYKNVLGLGIEPQILVVNEDIDFGRVYIGDTRDTLDAVTITNAGNFPVNISKTEHAFPNAIDFTTIKGAGPFTLNPGDTCRMDLAFTANSLGKTSGLLLFHHDAVGSPHQVTLHAEGYARNTVDIEDIVFADQPVGTANDSTVSEYFHNSGLYENKVENVYLANGDFDQFELKNITVPFHLAEGTKLNLDITFSPTSTGNKQTNLYMICQSDTIIRNVIGRSTSQGMEIITGIIDYGTIELGQRVDSTDIPILVNTGTEDLILSQVTLQGTDIIDFETGNGFSSSTLAEGDTLFVDLSFNPQTTGSKTSFIEILHNLSAPPAIVNVFGKAIEAQTPTISISIPDLEARAGEIINLPIILEDTLNMHKLVANGMTAKIEFNSYVMLPTKELAEIHLNQGLITFNEFDVNKNIGDTLAMMPFSIMLGDKEVSPILFSEITAKDKMLLINTKPGSLKLIDLCEDGGKRFFNPDGIVGISNLSPNPAENRIQIDFSVIEAGYTEITLVNMLGQTVATLFAEDISDFQDRQIIQDISEIGSGQYILQFKTPTYVERRKVMVVR